MADSITKWFVTRFILNKLYNLDAGFITENISAKQIGKSRQIFISEDCMANVENALIKEFGKKAEEVLYKTGKSFGFAYTNFIKDFSIESATRDIKLTFIFHFFEIMYANKINFKVDWNKKLLELEMDDFIICRKNGKGNLFTEGAAAGLWASICKDKTIEAKKIACQGRGDKKCKVILAPPRILKDKVKEFIEFPEFDPPFIDDKYISMNNAVSRPDVVKASIQDMIDFGFMTHKAGALKMKEYRFFPTEVTFLVKFEEDILQNFGDQAEKIIFEATEEKAIPIGVIQKTNELMLSIETLQKILSATGFGTSFFKGEKNELIIYFSSLPWAKPYKNSKLPFLRGFISGFLKGSHNDYFIVKQPKTYLTPTLDAKFEISIEK